MGPDGPLVASVVGTRPEAIKMAPVLRALSRRTLAQRLYLTGQHVGLVDSFAFLAPGTICELGIDPCHQSAGEICEAIRDRLCGRLVRQRPDFILVQGDTSSALAGALAAHECGIPCGHVEAGLRSFDAGEPWPEEANRIRIDRLSALLFAPNAAAAHNLSEEPAVKGRTFVTGNSGIDALFAARGAKPPRLRRGARRPILVTCHRRENQGPGLEAVAAALKRLVAELPVAVHFALHPNPHLRRRAEALLADVEGIALLAPMGHTEMVALLDRCWIIVTDSGGLQEEGPALGKPVLVLRNVTERAEAGVNVELVGTDPDRIVAAVDALLRDPEKYRRMAVPTTIFGDGRAGERIAAIVEAYLRDPEAPIADLLAAPRDGPLGQ